MAAFAHILNGIYLADHQGDFSPAQLQAAQVRHILTLETLPNLPKCQVRDLGMVGDLPTTQTIQQGALALHHYTQHRERVLVVSQKNYPCSVAIVLGYLVGYEGMDFANAYTLIANNLYMIRLPYSCLSQLVKAYNLSYHDHDLLDHYFTSRLIALVREQIHRIHRNIYLSGIIALERQTKTYENGIRAVLRLDDRSRTESLQWSENFDLCDLPLSDGLEIPDKVFRKGTQFLRTHAQGGQNTLVHCEMGISRSATLLLAYLLEYEDFTLPQAYALMVKQRAIAHPHPRLFLSLVNHYNLPYTESEALALDFRNQLLLEANQLSLSPMRS